MRSLLLICFLIAAIGIAAPGMITRFLVRPAENASPAADLPKGHPGARSGQQSSAANRFEVKAESDGHFYVDAEINRRRVHLIVDTGASVVALRRSDAEAVGIRAVPADFDHPVATANGTVNGAEANLDSVSVADIEVDGVRALVLPDESLSVSLLGATFLNRLARFQVSDGSLMFEN